MCSMHNKDSMWDHNKEHRSYKSMIDYWLMMPINHGACAGIMEGSWLYTRDVCIDSLGVGPSLEKTKFHASKVTVVTKFVNNIVFNLT